MPKTDSENSKLLALSVATGVGAGLAAVLLLSLIQALQRGLSPLLGNADHAHWIYLVLPAIGMMLSYLIVRFIVKDKIGHGVTRVLEAVSRNESRIKPHNMWSSVVTSSLTIGFGGSVGAEAPIVYTGAAIGSNLGHLGKLSYRSITTLVGCGAAGAIAGIFKAPLAGVLFTLEILLFNISMSSMMPLLLSTVSATVVAYLFTGSGSAFTCAIEPFAMHNLPFYLILGIVSGLFSLYFTRVTLSLEDKLSGSMNSIVKWLLCSLGLGILLMLFTPLYGEGYNTVTMLLNGSQMDISSLTPLGILGKSAWGIPVFFLAVILLKVVAMTLTNAGGGVGGTFGPTLVVGAFTGFVLARTLNLLLPQIGFTIPEQNFTLAGMAGLMAGVMQAPMTAIFLIAEITGGYELLLPLILVSTVSFGVNRIWERYSIYTKRIAQRGELLTHNNDQAVLTLLKTKDLIRDKYPRLKVDQTLAEIMETVTSSTAAVFPVLDDKGRFQGLVEIDDLRKYTFYKSDYDSTYVYNLMKQPEAIIGEDEKMDSVLAKFETYDVWRLPVLTDDRKYLGFISKSRILMAYRDELKNISSQD